MIMTTIVVAAVVMTKLVNKESGTAKIYNNNNLSYNELYESIKNRIGFLSLSCEQQTVGCFDRLSIKKNKNLLLNILEFGLQEKIDKVYKGVTANA